MNYFTINQNILRRIYKRRENWSHKGDFGRLLVIGGSTEYTGSPALVALSALRSGADFVKIIAPKRAADVCAGFSPELIAIPLNKDYLDLESVHTVNKYVTWANTLEFGNGIGEGNSQQQFVNAFAKEAKKKTVLDADALKQVNPDLLNRNVLITPNSHEFEVLFDTKISKNVEERVKAVKESAKAYDTTILLKGHVDIISDGDQAFINKNNSVYMTKAGTGDTLAGICAGLIAQGNGLLDSACAAALINGYTGRSIARNRRESISPIDIIDAIYTTITKWRYK